MKRSILPYNSKEQAVDGDLLFHYSQEIFFTVLNEQPDLEAAVGYSPVYILDGEERECVFVAEINALSFTVCWWPSTLKAVEEIAEQGHRLLSETTARRYFPSLQDYEFRSGR